MATRTYKSLVDLFGDVAEQKHRAAVSRGAGSNPSVSKAREVYLEGCFAIAAHFADLGFKYSASGQRFTKRGKELSHSVWFQSSRYNVPGELVALSLDANILSPLLKKWRSRQQHPIRPDDWVGGGPAAMLAADAILVEWNLAPNPTATVEEAVDFIRARVLPYFQRFSTPTAVVHQLLNSWPPGMQLGAAVEFALCFGTHENAQTILTRYLRQTPVVRSDVAESVIALDQTGFPSHFVSKYSDQVAWLCKAYHLSWQVA